MAGFDIPPSSSGLRKVDESLLDLRPEGELVADLKTFRPITSEKNVWAYWDKGFDAMYPFYRNTVINWIRKLGPSWTIRLVDTVDGSPNNIYNFVDKDWFPDCFINRTMDGLHPAQHASDLLRLPLLYEHGGVWMDVGNMLHTHLDDLFWDALSTPDSPYEMGAWVITGQIRKQWGSIGNFMLAARKGCEFIKQWHLGYKALWAGRTSADGFHTNPIIRDIGLAEGMADWKFEDKILGMSDYVAHMLIADRTRNLVDVHTGWNGREFFENKVFMVEGIYNGVLGAIKTDFDGRKQVDIFTTPLDGSKPAGEKHAQGFVVDMLENCHMYKVYHNSADGLPALGDLVKKAEFYDAVDRKGTVGELYRYGTVHWASTRKVEQLEPQPAEEPLIYATASTAQGHPRSTNGTHSANGMNGMNGTNGATHQ